MENINFKIQNFISISGDWVIFKAALILSSYYDTSNIDALELNCFADYICIVRL
jgi:hypothetical protein